MATIDIGAHGNGGKRSVDHEIPLIPFIDLLLCCVMFLLVTAVWNHLSSVRVAIPSGGGDAPPAEALQVRVTSDRYFVTTNAGLAVEVPRTREPADRSVLEARLREVRPLFAGQTATVQADDGIRYDELVEVVDALTGTGFPNVNVSGN